MVAMEIAELARQRYEARQRDGHKMPDWDGLPALMREALIDRERRIAKDILIGEHLSGYV